MKKQRLNLIGTLALLLVAGSAFGQTTRLKADVPFDFVVSGKTLPAGEYIVRSSANGILSVQSSDSGRTTMVMASGVENGKASAKTKLVFRHYGNRYFLGQVWTAGDNSGLELPKSDHEVELSMDYSVSNAIVVAGLR